MHGPAGGSGLVQGKSREEQDKRIGWCEEGLRASAREVHRERVGGSGRAV